MTKRKPRLTDHASFTSHHQHFARRLIDFLDDVHLSHALHLFSKDCVLAFLVGVFSNLIAH